MMLLLLLSILAKMFVFIQVKFPFFFILCGVPHNIVCAAMTSEKPQVLGNSLLKGSQVECLGRLNPWFLSFKERMQKNALGSKEERFGIPKFYAWTPKWRVLQLVSKWSEMWARCHYVSLFLQPKLCNGLVTFDYWTILLSLALVFRVILEKTQWLHFSWSLPIVEQLWIHHALARFNIIQCPNLGNESINSLQRHTCCLSDVAFVGRSPIIAINYPKFILCMFANRADTESPRWYLDRYLGLAKTASCMVPLQHDVRWWVYAEMAASILLGSSGVSWSDPQKLSLEPLLSYISLTKGLLPFCPRHAKI